MSSGATAENLAARPLFRRVGFEAHLWHIADSVQCRERRRATRWLMREYAAWSHLLVRRGRE